MYSLLCEVPEKLLCLFWPVMSSQWQFPVVPQSLFPLPTEGGETLPTPEELQGFSDAAKLFFFITYADKMPQERCITIWEHKLVYAATFFFCCSTCFLWWINCQRMTNSGQHKSRQKSYCGYRDSTMKPTLPTERTVSLCNPKHFT